MNDQPLYQPFGAVLKAAMAQNGISRAELARRTGISENSFIRYELAGLSKAGQYPPGPKLAKICAVLDVDPQKAMISCLTEDEFWEFEGEPFREFELSSHPYFQWMQEQTRTIWSQNALLRSGLDLVFEKLAIEPSKLEESDRWLFGKLRRLGADLTQAEVELLEASLAHIDAYSITPYRPIAEEWGTGTYYQKNKEQRHMLGLTKKQQEHVVSTRKRSLRQAFEKFCPYMASSDLEVLIGLFESVLAQRQLYSDAHDSHERRT